MRLSTMRGGEGEVVRGKKGASERNLLMRRVRMPSAASCCLTCGLTERFWRVLVRDRAEGREELRQGPTHTRSCRIHKESVASMLVPTPGWAVGKP